MSNIHSLESTKGKSNKNHSSDESDDEGDDKNRQGFFVGGSEHSGQEVLGPPGRRNRDFVSSLFDAARNAGAEQISPEEAEASANSSAATGSSSSSYRGGVYMLGGHGQPSQPVEPPVREGRNVQAQVVVNFNVWTNGFSIDDGPLRTSDDPENRPLLQAIMRGEIPQELLDKHPGRKIDFHLIRKQTEYVAPKPKPFSGEGNRLGAVVPNVVGNSSLAESEVVETKPSESEATKLLKEAQEGVGLNTEEPTTRIQIRLPTNQTFVGNFNNTHTVEDVRTFVVTADPSLSFRPFQFLTTYPTSVIDKEELSLKEAGLLNSAILVKFIQ